MMYLSFLFFGSSPIFPVRPGPSNALGARWGGVVPCGTGRSIDRDRSKTHGFFSYPFVHPMLTHVSRIKVLLSFLKRVDVLGGLLPFQPLKTLFQHGLHTFTCWSSPFEDPGSHMIGSRVSTWSLKVACTMGTFVAVLF